MSHAIGLKFTFFRNFEHDVFCQCPDSKNAHKINSCLCFWKKRERISPCGSDHMNAVWKITPHQGGWKDPSSVTSVQTEYGCLSCKCDGDSSTSVPQPSSGCLWSQALMAKLGWKPTSHGWEWGSLKGLGAGPPPAASLLLSCFRAGCWPPPAACLLLSCFRTGCWPPARSIPASLLLQGWVLAPRLQHPCFSPACLLPLSHPFPGRHFLNMKQKKQIVTYNLLPCQRRCIF